MNEQWKSLKFEAHPLFQDAIINRMFELGALGSEEKGHSHYCSYFLESTYAENKNAIQAFLSSLLEQHPEQKQFFEFELETIEWSNWSEKYRQHFEPQALSKKFYLVPPWNLDAIVPPSMTKIILEPGQAFGTGLHPTTRLVLEQLENWCLEHLDLTDLSVFDIGTGTGILALAASMLGFKNVVAVDNDPVAVNVAIENFQINHCKSQEISIRPVSEFLEKFDLILANILLETHRELAADYVRLLKPGGTLILSGLLSEQSREVDSIFSGLGLTKKSAKVSGEWLVSIWG